MINIRSAILILSVAYVCAGGWRSLPDESRASEKSRKVGTGRSFLAETRVDRFPAGSLLSPDFDRERVWSGHDDWEPALAAEKDTPYVYQLTTRYSGPKPCGSCSLPAIAFRYSSDEGATWSSDQYIAITSKLQADPEIEVAAGSVFAAFLNGWDIDFVKSTDHGKTWMKPVNVAGVRNEGGFADKPILAVSADGLHVYIGFNAGDAYVSASHNGGRTFLPPVRISHTQRDWFHTGGAVGADGAVYFSTTDFVRGYRGDANIRFLKSTDFGETWKVTLVDTSKEVPGCSSVPGCSFGFIGPSAAMAIDSSGRIMIEYHANDVAGAPQQMFIRTSVNGADWTPRKQVSSGIGANSAFPALAAGNSIGDFRIAWQDDRNGTLTAWNTWFRRTHNGGVSWSPALRVSDSGSGAPYKTSAGYSFPYGDYFELAVGFHGRTHLIWGEGMSWNGPGGTWYTRSRN